MKDRVINVPGCPPFREYHFTQVLAPADIQQMYTRNGLPRSTGTTQLSTAGSNTLAVSRVSAANPMLGSLASLLGCSSQKH